jgi:hypothetical protein
MCGITHFRRSQDARLSGILLEWHNRRLQRLVHPACTAERLRTARLTPAIPPPVPDRLRWRCRSSHWQHQLPATSAASNSSCSHPLERHQPKLTGWILQSIVGAGTNPGSFTVPPFNPTGTPSFQVNSKENVTGSLQWGTGDAGATISPSTPMPQVGSPLAAHSRA